MIGRLIVALLCATVLVAGPLVYLVVQHRDQQGSLAGIRPSGIPASVSTSLADLMQLSPVPARPAPGFTLTDQAGHVLSLASFRGRAVVLQFMDPHCTDICPIVSQEFIDAYRDLGRPASRASSSPSTSTPTSTASPTSPPTPPSTSWPRSRRGISSPARWPA